MSADGGGTTEEPGDEALAQLIARRDGAYARATAFIPQLHDPSMSAAALTYDQLTALAEYDHYRALVDIAVASGRPDLARELLRHADTDPATSTAPTPTPYDNEAGRRTRHSAPRQQKWSAFRRR